MFVVSKTNVLTVGISDKAGILRELPIRLVSLKFASDAIRSLKTEKFDSVVSKWNLADMENGLFLKALKRIKPDMPTIAIIESGNSTQEIAARSLGVSVVLTEDSDDRLFLETVSQVLGLQSTDAIEAIYAVEHK